MEHNTCYVHSTEMASLGLSLVMRAERYWPEWNMGLRATVGESDVVKVNVSGKACWAVPWRHMEKALTLCKSYFDVVSVERRTLLGKEPFEMPNTGLEVARILECGVGYHPDSIKHPSKVDRDAPIKFIEVRLEVMEVGLCEDDPGKSEVLLAGDDGDLKLIVDRDQARMFGSRIYQEVIVTVRDLKHEEIT